MTVPLWPFELPRPRRDSYQHQIGDGRLKSQPDAGPSHLRRRSSTPAAVTMAIDVSRDQRARFERFWREDTADASLPFFIPDASTDGV